MTEPTTPTGGVNPVQVPVTPVQQPVVTPSASEQPLPTQTTPDPAQPVDPNAAPPVSAPDPNATVPPATETGQGDEQERTRKTAKDRIQELVAQRNAAQAERDAALSELDRLRRPLQTQVPYDQLPFEQQEQVRIREAVRAERAEEAAQAARMHHARVEAQRIAVFDAKLAAATDRLPDAKDKFLRVPCSDVAADFIAESERAPELANYLGSNPAEAYRIANLPDTRQVAELARLEGRLGAAPPVRRVSQAPAPVTTVGGASPPRAFDPATADNEAYRRWRMQKPPK